MAEKSISQVIELIGFEGGRAGLCIVELPEIGEVIRLTPAELQAHPRFSTLPDDDRARIRWLAERAQVPVLAPCSSCAAGTNGKRYLVERIDDCTHAVQCGVCGAEGPSAMAPGEAIGRWNQRVAWLTARAQPVTEVSNA